MTVQRMDHVGVVVSDLPAAVSFFQELGLELDGETSVEGAWVDRVIGLEGVRSQIAMMRTPDRHSTLELTQFLTPAAPNDPADAPANALGIRHLTFAVDRLDEVLERLRVHGAELVGEVEDYRDIYRLCYLRGPDGIIIELAERLG